MVLLNASDIYIPINYQISCSLWDSIFIPRKFFMLCHLKMTLALFRIVLHIIALWDWPQFARKLIVRGYIFYIYTFISFPLFFCKNILSKFSREKALKDKNFSGRSWYAYEIGKKNITCIMLLCSKRSRRLGSRE